MEEQSAKTQISPKAPRKRARSKSDKAKRNLLKYPLLSACTSKCSLNCAEEISEEHRSEIRHSFRSLDFDGRRQWLDAHVSVLGVKKKKKSAQNPRARNHSLLYTLPMPNAINKRVCKVMFLATIGAKCDSIVMEFVRSKVSSSQTAILPTKDRRGAKKKDKNELHDQIIQHINSFNPCVSHYQRENAPNRRYLDCSLTVKGNFKVI